MHSALGTIHHPQSAIRNPQPPMPTHRPAHPDEHGRAASLFAAPPSAGASGPRLCFVAVREEPVERLVAAAFWGPVMEADGTFGVEFDWAASPALAAEEQEAFLRALVEEIGSQAGGVAWIAPAKWLPEGHAAVDLLVKVGFAPAGERALFGVEAAQTREILVSKQAAESPGELREPAPEDFEALRALLCGPALRPADLAMGMKSAASHQPSLYDPRCSAVIVREGAITAACLANSSHGHLSLAALAGPPDDCKRLLLHALQGRDHLPEPTAFRFQIDHRQAGCAFSRLIDCLPCQSAGRLLRLQKKP
jgi:hypothetical protein